MRRVVGILLAATSFAGDPVDEAADEIAAAAPERLAELAARDEPEPWAVAEALCARGAHDRAAAFARASRRVATEGLSDYVAARRAAPVADGIRAAVRKAFAAHQSGRHADALAALDSLDIDDTVTGIQAGIVRGAALRGLRRLEESARVCTAAAGAAERIGWRVGEATAVREAAMSAYMRADWRGALAAWERQLPLEEALGREGLVARTLANLGEAHRGLGDIDRALAYCARARERFEALGDEALLVQLLGNIGVLHQNRGEFPKAIEHQQRSLDLARRHGNRMGVYRALSNLGSIHHALGDLARARDFLAKALALATELGEELAVAGTRHVLGAVAVSEADYGAAIEHQQAAAEIYARHGRRDKVGAILRALAISYRNRGDYELAADRFERSLRILEEIGDRSGVANTYMSYGALLEDLGELDRARAALRRSLALWEAAGDLDGVAAALGALGTVHVALGEYAIALDTMERGRALRTRMGHRVEAAKSLANIAMLHRTLGHHEKARAQLENALAVFEETGQTSALLYARQALGNLHLDLGNHDEALRLHRETMSALEAAGAKDRVANVLSQIGVIHFERGEYAEARAAHERALRIGEEVGKPALVVAVLNNLADAHGGLGRHADAIDCRRRAVAIARARGFPELEARLLHGLAMSLWEGDRPGPCVQAAREAAEAMAGTVLGLADEQAARARERWADLFALGVRAAVATEDPGAAWMFMERGRAGALLETLGGRDAVREATVPADLRAAEEAARRAIVIAHARLRSAIERKDRERIRARQAGLDTARARADEVVARIQRSAKAAAGVVYPEFAGLDALQKALAEGDTFVQYFVDDRVTALVVTRGAVRLAALGPAPEPPDGPIAPAEAERLRDRLVAPLGAGKGRLIVSPHGALAYVPMAALAPGRAIVHAPSGAAYLLLLGERVPAGRLVLAIGDPDYGARADPNALTLKRSGGALVRLPATRAEAEAVGDVVLLGAEATETRFRETIGTRPRWRAVHFACHGLVHPERPVHSSLALAADDANDGFLTVLDLFRARIPADLVVLSACETARGKVYRAEGVVGLTRAFMVAGASRVLASLWKVEDEATRALMVKFYELWSRAPAAEALLRAQDHVRTRPQWRDPEFWAAWQLWGRPD